MGLRSGVLVRLFRAQPFESEALDQLAQTMNDVPLLRKEKNQRYYLSQTLAVPCISTSDAIIFNARFYYMLQPGEVLAVTAHEFSHTVKKHTRTRFSHILLPSALIAVLVGGLLAVNPFSISTLSYLDDGLPLVGSVIVFFALMLFVSFHLNSKMLRQQETECDLSALDYGYGQAMISVLAKTNTVLVQPKWQMMLNKLIPKVHPTVEQRISAIQAAIDRRKPIDYIC